MADSPDRSATAVPATQVSGRALELGDLAALEALAARLAAPARSGDAFMLSGELGAGKTTFARAFIGALARRENVPPPADVPSPTFTLMQSYEFGAVEVFHFDLYRLDKPDEVLELGIEDTIAQGIALIEWPDRLGPYMPRDRVDVDLAITGATSRRATVRPHGRTQSRYAAFAS